MKKIIILTENYVEGGLDTFITDLIIGLSKKYQIELLCNASHPGLTRIKKLIPKSVFLIPYSFLINSPIYRSVHVGKITGTVIGRILLKLTRKIMAYPFLIYMIIYWSLVFIKKNASDLIVVNGGYPGGLVCRAAGIAWYISKRKKTIYSIHNFWESIPLIRVPFEFLFDILTVFSAKNLLTVSNAAKDSLDTNPVFRFMNAPTSVIYNGSKIPSASKYLYHKDFSQRNYYTVLAAYEPRKGHEDLIHAIYYLKQNNISVKVNCYGHIHDEYHSNLEALIKRLGLKNQIQLNPFNENIDEILDGSRALIIPSKSFESFGLVAVEAFFRNVPVIAYRLGGLVEVVSSDVGLLVDVGDIEGLANAIKILTTDQSIWNTLSANAFNYAETNYSIERMIKEYELALGETS